MFNAKNKYSGKVERVYGEQENASGNTEFLIFSESKGFHWAPSYGFEPVMYQNKDKLFEEMMKELEQTLEYYKKLDHDYYLKTLGEMEKMLKKYFGMNEE